MIPASCSLFLFLDNCSRESIHLSIHSLGCRGSSLSRDTQMFISSATSWAGALRLSQVSWETYSGHWVLGLPWELLPVGQLSRRHPSQLPWPPQLTISNVEEYQLYSESLPNDQGPQHVSKGELSILSGKAKNCDLKANICFNLIILVIGHRWGWESMNHP